MKWDVFICHASEDKKEIAEPLANELMNHNIRVWYDKFTLKLGDSLRRSIDSGLSNSIFGIVILSPSFFNKEWTRRELDGLAAREINGEKVILPVWHNVSYTDVLKFSPTLADRFGVSTSDGIDKVTSEIVRVLDSYKKRIEKGPLKSRLQDELENALRLKEEYQDFLNNLPQGCLAGRNIRGHEYYYLVRRVGKKVKYFYKGKLSEAEKKKYTDAKNMRVKYRKLLAQVKKQIRFLKSALRGKEPI